MGPILLFIGIIAITGVFYPLAVTGISWLVFPDQANGSLLKKDGQVIGSELIAQEFKDPKYFWPRPSASNYKAIPSEARHMSPLDPNFPKNVRDTMSASGLDPHIPLEMAYEQIPRIAKARALKPEQIRDLVDKAEKPYINVLMMNLELDRI